MRFRPHACGGAVPRHRRESGESPWDRPRGERPESDRHCLTAPACPTVPTGGGRTRRRILPRRPALRPPRRWPHDRSMPHGLHSASPGSPPGPRRRAIRATTAVATLLTLLAAGAATAQTEPLCADASQFLVESRTMAAITEVAHIDDWRTAKRTMGCQVTAAGVTRRSARDEAIGFFDALRAAGWTRTPNPRDAPGESSLRFRKAGSDCLFSFYTGGMLGTEAERSVSLERVPGPGERRVHFLVTCVPAEDVPALLYGTGPLPQTT